MLVNPDNASSPERRQHASLVALQLHTELAFRVVTPCLAEAGIEHRLLKGPHLASTVYDKGWERGITSLQRGRDPYARVATASSRLSPVLHDVATGAERRVEDSQQSLRVALLSFQAEAPGEGVADVVGNA